MNVSIIVVTKNRHKHLLRCLKSLLRVIRKCDEIIIVDSSTSDGLRKLLPQHKQIRYFYKPSLNMPEARNFGVMKAEGDILLFIDDDAVVINNDFIDKLLEVYEKYPDAVGVGGMIIEEYKPFGSPGCRILPWGDLTTNFQAVTQEVIEVDALKGCCMSFKKEALLKAGLFDPNYEGCSYMEEIDLCLRIRRLGKLYYQPKAMTRHYTQRPKYNILGHACSLMSNYIYFYMKNFILARPSLILFFPLFIANILWKLAIVYRHPLGFYGLVGALMGMMSFKRRLKCWIHFLRRMYREI